MEVGQLGQGLPAQHCRDQATSQYIGMQQLERTEVLPLSLDAALLTTAGQVMLRILFLLLLFQLLLLCCRLCLP